MITLILKDTVNDRDWSLQTEADVLLVGRNRDAQVCIRDRSVSKNHCRIEKRGNSYRFKDLKSRNGTYINDLRCDGGPIENGDELKVGNFVILFQTSEAADQAAATFDQPPGDFDLDGDFDALMDDATLVGPAGGNPFLDPDPAAPAAASPPGQAGVTPELPTQIEPQQQMPPQQAQPQQQPPPQQAQPQQQMPPQQAQPQQQMPPQQQQPLQFGDDLGFEAPLEQGQAPGRGSSKFSKTTSKYARRKKTRPELELEEELFGTEDPLRKPSRAKGKWDTSHVALFVIFSLLLGLALGVMLARVMKSAPPPAEPPVIAAKPQPVPGATQPANPAPQAATSTPPAPAAPKPLDPALEALLGKRADLGDSETSSRHCMRLFLDSLNRSPTRAELAKYRLLSHQERWNAIQVLARSEGSAIPLKYVSLAQIYLGPDRLPTANEKDHLMVQTNGAPERIGYTIISSTLYSSAEFTRDRNLPQRARSLLVDLRDSVPKESDVTDVTDLLETDNADPKEILEVLLESSVGPAGGNTDQWIEESYLRFLLRSPTAAETNEARSKITGAEDGWREVILSLTLQQGYQSY
ncbi:MAG: FHA domain-containing protein [Planctomycetota bacterium]|nr:FHA domain-containing protein [Planctomycetota bacterium]